MCISNHHRRLSSTANYGSWFATLTSLITWRHNCCLTTPATDTASDLVPVRPEGLRYSSIFHHVLPTTPPPPFIISSFPPAADCICLSFFFLQPLEISPHEIKANFQKLSYYYQHVHSPATLLGNQLNCLLTQTAHQPITLQRLNEFRHADVRKTAHWRSKTASASGRRAVLSDFESDSVFGARWAGLSISQIADRLWFFFFFTHKPSQGFKKRGRKMGKYPVSSRCVGENARLMSGVACLPVRLLTEVAQAENWIMQVGVADGF